MRHRGDLRARFELKSVAVDSGAFEGYGAVFDVVDTYRDVILPGAFAETLAEHARRGTAPRMLWFHDPGKAIGSWSDFREDERGLYCSGRLDLDHPEAAAALGCPAGTLKSRLSRGRRIFCDHYLRSTAGQAQPSGAPTFDDPREQP